MSSYELLESTSQRHDTISILSRFIELPRNLNVLSLQFQGGVIVSVDSRATQGPYIASQSVKKVIEINPFLLGMTFA